MGGLLIFSLPLSLLALPGHVCGDVAVGAEVPPLPRHISLPPAGELIITNDGFPSLPPSLVLSLPSLPLSLSLCLTMAGDGDGTSSKSARNNAQPSTPSQEPQQPPAAAPTPPAYAEWAAAFHQAYYASASSGGTAPVPPPPPHPFIWPSQFMPPPPYGAIPPPQGAVYPAPFGGFYLHHSLPPPSHLSYNPYGAYNSNPEAAVVANPLATAESSDVKTGDGKEQKKPSPSLGKVSGGVNAKESLPSEPANGSHSRSGESGSEGSSEDSEDAPPPNSFHLAQDNRGEHQLNLNGGTEAFHPSIIATGAKPMAMAASSSVPTTSLNIGMDYWSGATSAQMPGMYSGGGKRKGTSANHSEFWDEREVKRQRRKQSNRESARRSRLRKQAEYEEVTKIAVERRAENESLRSKLDSLREDYKRLVSTNETLRAQLRCDNAGNGILQEHKAVENDSVQEEGKRREMVNTGNNEGGGIHVEICINNNDPARSSNQGEDRDNSNRTQPQLHQLISKKRLLMNLQPPFNPSVSAK